jgi:1,4-alpha-glucan branching enzyme
MQGYVRELNHLYKEFPALWQQDHTSEGFEWIDPHAESQSIVSFIRKGTKPNDFVVVLCNFTPVVYEEYRIGVPKAGWYEEVLNSDADRYGGSGQTNPEALKAEKVSWHNRPYSVKVKVPPLAAIVFHYRSRSAAQR